MSALTSPPPASLAAAAPLVLPAVGLQPSSQSGLDFASLLAAQLGSSPAGATDQSLTSLSGLTSPSSGGLEGLLTYAVLRLIERLLNATGPAAGDAAAPAAAALPVIGTLTQGYHDGHHGLDIAVPIGTPVHSTQTGRVIHAGWNDEGYGNLVIVENGPYRTYYAHLDQIGVHVGDQLGAGAVLGLSGSTGNSTGPHVHYEVRLNGSAIDPTEAPGL